MKTIYKTNIRHFISELNRSTASPKIAYIVALAKQIGHTESYRVVVSAINKEDTRLMLTVIVKEISIGATKEADEAMTRSNEIIANFTRLMEDAHIMVLDGVISEEPMFGSVKTEN